MNERTKTRELSDYKRIVIKIGTTSLTYENGKMNLQQMERFAWVLTDLKNQGMDVILVSSGAIAVGTDRLGLSERPRETRGKQAASAVGQAVLMQIYENFFMRYNQHVAQILLTKDVIDDEVRKQNVKNTLFTLFDMGVLPIVNENDTVSTEELGFSENDSLSAYVAIVSEADLLVLLTDTAGLMDSDPKVNADAKMVSYVDRITDELLGTAGEAGSKLGTGGMYTKVCAAKIATDSGIDTIIASGGDPVVLFDLLNGENIGTFFKSK